MKNLIHSVIETDNKIVDFVWHSNKIIKGIRIHNIYGFCCTADKKIVLVRDNGEERFTLPGGRVEYNEKAKEALIREFTEEVQFVPKKIKLLGSLEVKIFDRSGNIIDHHQQTRFECRVIDPGEFIPQKNGWETVERIFCEVKDLPQYLEWIAFPTGKIQFPDS